ncbi:MAG: GNAT family N-acetyltransferase [Candidatus Brocadiia bacterium]
MAKLPILETARLILRPFEAADAKNVQRLAGNRAVAEYTANIPHPYEDGMAEEWISGHQSAFEAGKSATFAIVLRESRELIGAAGLGIVRRFDHAELGYWIGLPYWNKGFCTAAAKELLRFAFQDLKLHRVYASHFAMNPASGRVMQKLGMTHEGVRREHVKRWGRYNDLVQYGILSSEWAG